MTCRLSELPSKLNTETVAAYRIVQRCFCCCCWVLLATDVLGASCAGSCAGMAALLLQEMLPGNHCRRQTHKRDVISTALRGPHECSGKTIAQPCFACRFLLQVWEMQVALKPRLLLRCQPEAQMYTTWSCNVNNANIAATKAEARCTLSSSAHAGSKVLLLCIPCCWRPLHPLRPPT